MKLNLAAWRLRCESDELLHLDFLRFIAAMAVVVYHFRNQWDFNGIPGLEVHQFDGLSLAVDLFFLISGVVITYVYANLAGARETAKFLQKRVARLVPLHWATMGFYVVVGLAYAKILQQAPPDADKYDWSCLPANAAAVHAWGVCKGLTFNHVSWSISAEMAMYLLFPVLFLPLLRMHKLAPAGAGLVAMAALFAVGPAGPEHRMWHEWTHDFGVLRAVPAFLIGMTLGACRQQLARLLPRAPWILAAAGAAFVVGLVTSAPREILLLDAYLIGAAALAADIQGRVAPWIKKIAPLGALTYGIYMLHPLLRTVLLAVVAGKVLHLHGQAANAFIVLSGILVIPTAWISLVLFEKPTRRILSRFGPAKPILRPAEAPVQLG